MDADRVLSALITLNAINQREPSSFVLEQTSPNSLKLGQHVDTLLREYCTERGLMTYVLYSEIPESLCKIMAVTNKLVIAGKYAFLNLIGRRCKVVDMYILDVSADGAEAVLHATCDYIFREYDVEHVESTSRYLDIATQGAKLRIHFQYHRNITILLSTLTPFFAVAYDSKYHYTNLSYITVHTNAVVFDPTMVSSRYISDLEIVHRYGVDIIYPLRNDCILSTFDFTRDIEKFMKPTNKVVESPLDKYTVVVLEDDYKRCRFVTDDDGCFLTKKKIRISKIKNHSPTRYPCNYADICIATSKPHNYDMKVYCDAMEYLINGYRLMIHMSARVHLRTPSKTYKPVYSVCATTLVSDKNGCMQSSMQSRPQCRFHTNITRKTTLSDILSGYKLWHNAEEYVPYFMDGMFAGECIMSRRLLKFYGPVDDKLRELDSRSHDGEDIYDELQKLFIQKMSECGAIYPIIQWNSVSTENNESTGVKYAMPVQTQHTPTLHLPTTYLPIPLARTDIHVRIETILRLCLKRCGFNKDLRNYIVAIVIKKNVMDALK